MPDQKTKSMVFYRDAELPTKGEGILFLDELNSAAPATQAAAMQLTLTGRIGDYVLPAGWSIIAAGNRESDRSVVNRMPAALSNRLTHIDFEVSLDDWCTWALKHQVSLMTVAFLRFRPDLLHKPDYQQRAFSTPRSNVFADAIINAGMPRDMEIELLKGTVGEGHAIELSAYTQVFKELPDIDKVIKDPLNAPLPTSPGALYATSTMLGAHASKKNFDVLMKYVLRLPTEFQTVTVVDALRQTEQAIAETAAFQAWGQANASVMM